MGSLYRIICKREDFLAADQHIIDIAFLKCLARHS